MTDELTDLEQVKKAERARERRWIAKKFSRKLLDTLSVFGIALAVFALLAVFLGAVAGVVLLIMYVAYNYGPVAAILTFIGEVVLLILVIAIVRTISDTIKRR